jgi:preprotein translocase subunit YajC
MLSGVDRFDSSENFPGILMELFLVPLLGVIAFYLMQREANNRSKRHRNMNR